MPLNGSRWPPGLEEVTIFFIATLLNLICSEYTHQSSCATASLLALCYQDWFIFLKLDFAYILRLTVGL